MEPFHWSEGRHNNVGVSLQERRATMQVMLRVSLRARWDTTLVDLIQINSSHFICQGVIVGVFDVYENNRQSGDSHQGTICTAGMGATW